jgi:hypothetical protein
VGCLSLVELCGEGRSVSGPEWAEDFNSAHFWLLVVQPSGLPLSPVVPGAAEPPCCPRILLQKGEVPLSARRLQRKQGFGLRIHIPLTLNSFVLLSDVPEYF